jgi:gliotoxin/aspirochlorine biosynthesis thioredoxin reductase
MLAQHIDVAVIGGGPAGIGATLGLARTKRVVAMFDSQMYRNAKVTEFHNVPGFDGKNPSDWRAIARADISEKSQYGTNIHRDFV